MKKIFWLTLFYFFIPKLLWSQYAIKLDSSNTFKYGSSYLIDIPVKRDIEKLLITDRQELIPVSAFLKYEKLCTPDTTIIIKPVNKHYLLTLNEVKSGYVIDSLLSIQTNPTSAELLYRSTPSKSADSVLIYYKEDNAHGACCDLPINRDTNTLNNYVSNFEKEHHTAIGKSYSYIYGDEGEHVSYLTLSGLTPQQKILFIDGRIRSLHHDSITPTVYRPTWFLASKLVNPQYISTPNKLDPNTIYTAVEHPPRYPKGEGAFKKYIYQKMNLVTKPTTPIITSFVVNRNGSLTDIKILRTPDDKLNQKLIYILSHAPKWKPGFQNKKAVRVSYTLGLYLP